MSKILRIEDMARAHARYLTGFAELIDKMNTDKIALDPKLDDGNELSYVKYQEFVFDWLEIIGDLVEDMVANARRKGWIEEREEVPT